MRIREQPRLRTHFRRHVTQSCLMLCRGPDTQRQVIGVECIRGRVASQLGTAQQCALPSARAAAATCIAIPDVERLIVFPCESRTVSVPCICKGTRQAARAPRSMEASDAAVFKPPNLIMCKFRSIARLHWRCPDHHCLRCQLLQKVVWLSCLHRAQLAGRGRSHIAIDAISPIPVDRWDCDRLLVPGVDANTAGVAGRFGGFVAGWASFDAALFSVSPSEAALMDPQQRVLLEVGHVIPRLCCTNEL